MGQSQAVYMITLPEQQTCSMLRSNLMNYCTGTAILLPLPDMGCRAWSLEYLSCFVSHTSLCQNIMLSRGHGEPARLSLWGGLIAFACFCRFQPKFQLFRCRRCCVRFYMVLSIRSGALGFACQEPGGKTKHLFPCRRGFKQFGIKQRTETPIFTKTRSHSCKEH